MVYTTCTCQGTCEEPLGCHYNCTQPEACVCPKGFLMQDGDCMPQRSCPCFIEEAGLIRLIFFQTGVTYVGPNCSMNCICHSDNLICENEYSCSFNGQCVEENQTSRCVCQDGFLGDGQICTRLIDCYEWYKAGNGDDGVYTILPAGWPGLPFEVFCDMSGGGWTVFQHRFDGSVDFYRDWESYKHGFGDLKTEFWLGNEKLFYFTTQGNYQLRIDLMNKFGNMYLAVFDLFRINNENDNYRLIEVGNYQGNAGWYNYTTGTGYPLSYHRGQSFSTHDRDNDKDYFNCALGKKGAWWYKNCYASNLNGLYTTPFDSESINWYNLPGYNAQVKYTQMKLQRV
ncbi:Tenascin-R [Holothuria leucospilota]|uniref:Tenascin-R n=1 Tax=Holothuria leucospilota TaxID=206669 RepID=A0A9Q1BWN3_HOLLE|nr:Tenascin-R [Holothuria leucospilota]